MKKNVFLLVLCLAGLMVVAQPVTIEWATMCGTGAINASSPAVSNDGSVIYFANGAAGKLYAVNANGTTSWNFSLGVSSSNPARTSTVVGQDGVIYVPVGSISSSNTPAYLYAINPNGQEKWKYTIGSGANIAYISPAITKSGDILTGNTGTNGALHLVNKLDGIRKAYTTVTSGVLGANVVSQDNVVYTQSGSNGFNAHNLNEVGEDSSPTSLGNFKLIDAGNGYAAGSPAIDSYGNLIVTGGTGKIASLSIQNNTLTQNWIYPANGNLSKIEQAGVAIAADGTYYIAGHENTKIFALNTDGSLKWVYETIGDAVSVPAIDNQGYIHFGDKSGYYYIIQDNGTFASEIYKAKLMMGSTEASEIWSSPAIADDGSIYIAAKTSTSNNAHLFKISVTGTTSPANSAWPMRGGNAQRTGLQKQAGLSNNSEITVLDNKNESFKVSKTGSGLAIKTLQAGRLSVTDIMGRIIFHKDVDVSDDIFIPVNNNAIYIVKLNNSVKKVIR